MSIAEQLTELNTIKTNLFTAISEKGVVIPEGSGLKDCPHMVENIPYVNNGWENSYAIINGHKYPTIKKGGVEWLAQNLDEVFDGMTLTNETSAYEPTWVYRAGAILTEYTNGSIEKLIGVTYKAGSRDIITANVSSDGWRIPSQTDWQNLISLSEDSHGLCHPLCMCDYGLHEGTNTTGFSIFTCNVDQGSDNGKPTTSGYFITSNSSHGNDPAYMITCAFHNAAFQGWYNNGSSPIWYNAGQCRLVRNY